MKLTREQKRKNLQLKINFLEARIERSTKKLVAELEIAKDKLSVLEHKGFRVRFHGDYGNYGTYHDFTAIGWGSMSAASRAVDKETMMANLKGIDTTVTDLFGDTPRISKEIG